ncbi:polyamine-transporting ATPase 13A3-like isoform X2 [Lineus longissimus]|uniref:polyamine-transporting ATPase 13A3-like isoform X2 n=1 Tax=Lineus longissimus TaxID=88925 RepID=UPI002B4C4EE1
MRDKIDKMIDSRTGPPPIDPNKTYVNPGEEDHMEIEGYTLSKSRQILTWIAIVLTLGFLRLIFHWKPEWMIMATHVQCHLEDADTVILKDVYKQVFVAKIKIMTKDGTRIEVIQNSHQSAWFSKSSGSSDCRTHLAPRHQPQSNEPEEMVSPLLNNVAHDDALIRFFSIKHLKYIWNGSTLSFKKLKGLEEGQTCGYLHMTATSGLTDLEYTRKFALYGTNSMPVRVQPIVKLLFQEVLNPFYIFQIFSCTLWYFDEYEIYASCIVFISLVSLSTGVYQTRKMQRELRDTIASSSIVSAARGSGFIQVPSDILVPGDVIEIPRDGCIMQCDAVLLSGNCIVNESMLTGESVPVTKTALPNSGHSGDQVSPPFNMKEHSKHVLFCGTKVIQTRYYGNQMVKAVVLRTGFMTAKGELVRAILFPKPLDFRFYQDTMKFVAFLSMLAGIGFIFTVVLMSVRGSSAGHIIRRALDVVTIAVNPALPAAMTIGVVFAVNRLKRSKVYCISPSHINICGTVNVVCFDKTGTLTEDGLDMWGVAPVENERFLQVEQDMTKLPREHLLYTMACCHSLTIIDGEICGDPLDLKMVEATNWEVEEPGEDTAKFDVIMPTVVRPKQPDVIRNTDSMESEVPPFEIGIVRQFTFSSSLQRMSVITRILGDNHYNLYTKGAPETITSLSKPETVPKDFLEQLMHYTQQGYRVIALAWKPLKLSYLKVQRVERKEVEKDLNFLGLLIMENRLKPETTPIIRMLKEANIRTVMVTGDNILTAVSVAVDCDMVGDRERVILVNVLPPSDESGASIEYMYAEDNKRVNLNDLNTPTSTKDSFIMNVAKPKYHFAITGKSWANIKQHFPDLIPKLVVRGTVFARMSPEQKAQLIEALQEVGYYVGMCGDGANDCGALRTAHTGISLSEAEASLASPFTSKEANIKCIPTVIREGRAALVTSFGVFKYLGCASFVQFITVILLYWIDANLTDFEFLFCDLLLIATLSITFGRTGAYPILVKEPPNVKLASIGPIISILVQTIIIGIVQFEAFFMVRQQPWFEKFILNDAENYMCHENAMIFLASSYQYIILAVVFSKGAPYRKTIFSNYWFMANLVLVTSLTLFINIYPTEPLASFLELKPAPSIIYRIIIVGMALANFIVCLLIQTFIMDNVSVKLWCQRVLMKKRFKKAASPFELIEDEIKDDPNWPPISESSTSLADLITREFVPNMDKKQASNGGVGNGATSFPPSYSATDYDVSVLTASPTRNRKNHGGLVPRQSTQTISHENVSDGPCFIPKDDPEHLLSKPPGHLLVTDEQFPGETYETNRNTDGLSFEFSDSTRL